MRAEYASWVAGGVDEQMMLWGSKLPLCLKLVVVQGLDMEMTSAVVGDGTVLILGHCLAQGLDEEAVSAAVGESSLDILPVYGSGYG